MRKHLAKLALGAVVIASAFSWTSTEAMVGTGTGLPSLVQSYSPVEMAGCVCGPYRCACGHPHYHCW
jgi:hypothetical protein